jgi:hypothetical protein
MLSLPVTAFFAATTPEPAVAIMDGTFIAKPAGTGDVLEPTVDAEVDSSADAVDAADLVVSPPPATVPPICRPGTLSTIAAIYRKEGRCEG